MNNLLAKGASSPEEEIYYFYKTIKKEIVDEHIKGKYFVKFVLDDRDQVVDMWRKEMGYACLQVNYGDF